MQKNKIGSQMLQNAQGKVSEVITNLIGLQGSGQILSSKTKIQVLNF